MLATRAEAKAVKKGDTIVLANPISFTDNVKADTFIFHGRSNFTRLPDRVAVRISKWRTRKLACNDTTTESVA